jgi:3-phosphoshikimate 1-carboxyvinyltransferase
MNISNYEKMLQIGCVRSLGGRATIPSSKPETQRAILAASLANGVSEIYNDLRCLETETMKEACRRIGAIIHEKTDRLVIHGAGGLNQVNRLIIDALGSGLVFRVFVALSCFATKSMMITGDEILCGRVMQPLFTALEALGSDIQFVHKAGHAPVINQGGGLSGTRCTVPGNVSSQFITAILFAAPLAALPIELIIEGEILSISYIKQTLEMLEQAGIKIDVAEDFSRMVIYPSSYQPFIYHVSGDYTSSSYLIAAASIFPGTTVLHNMNERSLQGERAIIDVIKKLGIELVFDDNENTLSLFNRHTELKGNFEFDASDYPNIVPTLAVLGSFVNGCFRVIGGSITRHHKSSRIQAIVTELTKLGVDIQMIMKDGVCDGFEIHGKSHYKGGIKLSSWGDHRIFMSLFVASLRCTEVNSLDGYQDVHCSFPEFFTEFKNLGVQSKVISYLENVV